jgi:hypothetical protein
MSSERKPKPFNHIAVIRGAIRRAFHRSPTAIAVKMAARREIPKFNMDGGRAKKDQVQYLCSLCGEWHKGSMVAVDHKIPVIDPEVGFVDWNTLIERVFCDESNLQVLCEGCHKNKTDRETAQRLGAKYFRELCEILSRWSSRQADERETVDLLKKYIKKGKRPGYEDVSRFAQSIYDNVATASSKLKTGAGGCGSNSHPDRRGEGGPAASDPGTP